MEQIRRSLSLASWSVHYEGLWFTLFRVAAKTLLLFRIRLTDSAWFRHLAQSRFDRRFNVETSGVVPTDQLGMSEARRLDAVEYAPTAWPVFGYALSNLALNFEDFVFVDFGCGKGRAILMASDFPFKRIMGVELSPRLQDDATENVASYRSRRQKCREIEVIRDDAANFEFPDDPLLLYFFNPFSAAVLTCVLDNLRRSLEGSPRPVIVMYVNPVHREVLEDSGLFNELVDSSSQTWAVYKAADTNAIGREAALCR